MWQNRRLVRSGLLLVVLLANLVPAAGVVAFDWTLSVVLLVYWFEWGAVVLVASFQACPARLISVHRAKSNYRSRPGTRYKHLLYLRRGTFSLGSLVCYYRNVPDIAKVVSVGGGAWTIVGIGWWYLDRLTVPSGSPGTLAVVAVVALVGTHALTAAIYFIEQRYRDCAPNVVLSVPAVYTIGAFVIVTPLLAGTFSMAAVGQLGILGIVGGKTAAELLVRRRKRTTPRYVDADPFDYELDHSGILSRTRPMASMPPVSVPDTAPIVTRRPDRFVLLARSPIRGTTDSTFVIRLGTLALLLGALAAASPFFFELSWQVAAGLFLLALALWAVVATLAGLVLLFGRYGSIEYRFYDDRLVCHDRLLSTAQWSLPYDNVEAWTIDREARPHHFGSDSGPAGRKHLFSGCRQKCMEQLYTEYPALYDAMQSDWDYDRDVSFVIELLNDRAPRDCRLLEVGCGTGEHTRRLVDTRRMTPFDDLDIAAVLSTHGVAFEPFDGFGPSDSRTVFVCTPGS